MVYILHFDSPFGHAKHYVGYCEDERFEARMKEHESGGSGASGFLKKVKAAGIKWTIAITYPGGDENLERRIKTVWKDTVKRCPICTANTKGIACEKRVSDLEMWERYWEDKTGNATCFKMTSKK